MKPAPFDYYAPRSLDEALALLGRHGGEARVLAGGQSLVPAMAFRLARPAVLVDINRVPGISGVARRDGAIVIGALTRHAVFEKPVTDGPLGGLLPRVARNIAHLPIRLRGTFGGSLAHADPSAEWCTLAVALDATMVARSQSGRRTIPASDFFRTIFTTDLQEGEMLAEIRLPALDGAWHCGFVEFNRRAGDFAIVSALAALKVERGVIREARLALGGVVDRAVRAAAAEKVLTGQKPSPELLREAAAVARTEFEPFGDIHGSSDYKSELVAVMGRRALEQALSP